MTATLITGGAGFIGTNLAHRLLSSGHTVYIFDNLSRQHVVRNLSWLMSVQAERLNAEIADIRDRTALRRVVKCVDHVFHLAAQVAVTSSVEDPKTDFDINVAGTLQLLEETRSAPKPPSLIYTSTNKVYGALERIPLRIRGKRYVRADGGDAGIDENTNLNFHSPYGCSKGAAEQYVLDYCRTYGIRSAVFRMSCIAGPHQFGNEDQGWVAHFLYSALQNRPVTIYGDGRQVRDVLHVEDLLRAFEAARLHLEKTAGEVYNVGGGIENSTSLLEIIDEIEEVAGSRLRYRMESCRPGDQLFYVTDYRKFQQHTGWRPRSDVRATLESICDWRKQNPRLFPEPVAPVEMATAALQEVPGTAS